MKFAKKMFTRWLFNRYFKARGYENRRQAETAVIYNCDPELLYEVVIKEYKDNGNIDRLFDGMGLLTEFKAWDRVWQLKDYIRRNKQ